MGKGLLLTRPAGFNDALTVACRQQGIPTFEAPLIKIVPCSTPLIEPRFAQPAAGQVQIYTSRNAVMFADPVILANARRPEVRVFGVGSATASQLKNLGIDAIAPQKPGSEALLELPFFKQIRNLQVTLVTGLGGRELLETTLRDRGATVVRVACYAREKVIRPDLEQIVSTRGFDHILITSVDLLAGLTANLGGPLISSVTLCVTAPRIASAAVDQGYQRIISAEDASSDRIMSALADIIWSR